MWDYSAASPVVTVFPIGYAGLLGPALLQTPGGLAFYVGLSAGTWLFLRAGAALRRRLGAPRRDRKIAILPASSALLRWSYSRMCPAASCRDRDRKSTTSELQSLAYLVCRLLLEKKKIG